MTITHIVGQSGRGFLEAGGFSIPVTMTLTPANGNTLIATIATYSVIEYPTVSSISQIGVTWTLQKYKRTDQFNFANQEIWKGVIGAGASKDVTIALSASAAAGAVADIYEYSSNGVLTLDQTADAEGVGSSPSTGTTGNTTVADELLIGGILGTAYLADQTTPTNGFTLFDGVAIGNVSEAYLEKIVSATGTYSSGTTCGWFYWCGCIATFFEGTIIPPQQIMLTMAVAGNGTTDLTAGAYQFVVGDTITINANPFIGSSFTKWTLNGSEYTANPLTLQITANMNGQTLTAEFNAIPVEPHVMLGIMIYGNWIPNDVSAAINTWVARVGKGVCWWNIVHLFGPLSTPETFWEFDAFAPMVTSGLIKGIVFSWQPAIAYTSPLDPNGACTQNIANGVYDAYINTVANQCKTAGYPIIMRLAHEMNGDWMGWGINPTVYKAMWIRVVNIFKSVGATNVKFHWCPAYIHKGYGGSTGYDFNNYYPGDAYVDYVGIDSYATSDPFYKYPINQILNHTDPAGNVYEAYPNKPYLIGEWGLNVDSELGDAANLAWLSASFDVIEANPRIIGMTPWNYDRYAVDTEPLTYAEYIKRISLGLYTSNLVQWTGIPPIPTYVTLIATADANGFVFPTGSVIMVIGQSYQFQATPKIGYNFDHWDLNGVNKGSSNPLQLITIADMEGKTLTALFTAIPPTPVTVNIAISGNGTTDLAPGNHEFHVGDTITISAIPIAGNAFKQWQLDGLTYTANPLALPVTLDLNGKTLTAEFVPLAPIQAGFPIWTIPVGAAILIGGYLLNRRGKNHKGVK